MARSIWHDHTHPADAGRDGQPARPDDDTVGAATRAVADATAALTKLLGNQLAETNARLEVGLLTRTDVARAEAQLAAAKGFLSLALSQLQISRANYATAVGQNPGELVPPAPLAGLPANVDDAFRAAGSGPWQ